jgi:hypothetical protein
MNLTLLEISPLFWDMSFIFVKYSDRSCKHTSSSHCRLLCNCGQPGLILHDRTLILMKLRPQNFSKRITIRAVRKHNNLAHRPH